MIHHIKRFAKKKSVISLFSVVAVTGTVISITQHESLEPTRYVLAAATRGAIVTSISASGQVSAQNELAVTPNVSGAIVRTFVALGEEVTVDTPLFEIDRRTAFKTVRNAEQSVRDAEINLEAAKISYEKLLKPQNASAVLQAQNALNQAERNLAKLQEGPDGIEIMAAEAKIRAAEQNAKLASDGKTPKIVRDLYDKHVAELNSLVVTLEKSLDDSNDILGVEGQPANSNLTTLFSILDQAKENQAYMSYAQAKNSIEKAQSAVDPLKLEGEDISRIESAMVLVDEALKTTATLLEDVKKGLGATLTSASFSQSSLDQFASTIQSDIASITNAYGTITSQKSSIEEAYESYENAGRTLDQAKAELTKLMEGPDPDDIADARETIEERRRALDDARRGAEDIDLKTAQNTIQQRTSALQNARNSLQDALEELNDYTVRAPFDGVIAKLDAKNASQASPSTVLATLLTKGKIAQVSLNEVDVSKVALGQKATLTFDAVPDLTIAGSVSEIDMVGTVTQGVVTYGVKISFLTDDARIKSGMSVSASIVTDMRSDVVMVPNSAIRRIGQSVFVSVLEGVSLNASSTSSGIPSEIPPRDIPVAIGISNDQYTEISDGLKEGDPIVVRTIQPIAATANQTNTAASGGNALRIPGIGGGSFGGGAPVMIRR